MRSQPVPQIWMAVHELTQGQWTALAGTRPWLDALPVEANSGDIYAILPGSHLR